MPILAITIVAVAGLTAAMLASLLTRSLLRWAPSDRVHITGGLLAHRVSPDSRIRTGAVRIGSEHFHAQPYPCIELSNAAGLGRSGPALAVAAHEALHARQHARRDASWILRQKAERASRVACVVTVGLLFLTLTTELHVAFLTASYVLCLLTSCCVLNNEIKTSESALRLLERIHISNHGHRLAKATLVAAAIAYAGASAAMLPAFAAVARGLSGPTGQPAPTH